jgi:hypothetical protein
VYRGNRFQDEQALLNERFRQAGDYITLYEEECADEEGSREELERLTRDWGSCHFIPNRGWARSSLVPYNLNQCRRASCSSHVVEGGGVALDSDSLKCETAPGPSHVDDGGGDALQGISFSEMDRSSPVQSERFRAGVDQSQY